MQIEKEVPPICGSTIEKIHTEGLDLEPLVPCRALEKVQPVTLGWSSMSDKQKNHTENRRKEFERWLSTKYISVSIYMNRFLS